VRIDHVEARWLRFPIAPERQHTSDFGTAMSFDAMLVEVATDTGLCGYGEGQNAAGSAGVYEALVALVNREMGPTILGRDPRDVGRIWDDLYSTSRASLASRLGRPLPGISRRGLTIAAISAIDIALWDILGK
jgi:L-alanine-DL-glutamate epimerase-like enolase superfamily enzyme